MSEPKMPPHQKQLFMYGRLASRVMNFIFQNPQKAYKAALYEGIDATNGDIDHVLNTLQAQELLEQLPHMPGRRIFYKIIFEKHPFVVGAYIENGSDEERGSVVYTGDIENALRVFFKEELKRGKHWNLNVLARVNIILEREKVTTVEQLIEETNFKRILKTVGVGPILASFLGIFRAAVRKDQR